MVSLLLEKSFRNGTLEQDEEDIKGVVGGLYGGKLSQRSHSSNSLDW